MLGPEDFMAIQALAKRCVYLCDIAHQLGVHPRTVRRALDRGGSPAPRRGRRTSLLNPYRPVIDQLLADGVWNAVVVWRELQAPGSAVWDLTPSAGYGSLCRPPRLLHWSSEGREFNSL